MTQTVRGRLAPSPTGFLHLGNAWAFLLAWLACRKQEGTLILRMEDIDPDRSRPEYAATIMDDLHWLGLQWDEGPDRGGPCGPYIQSLRMDHYEKAIETLQKAGQVYPCYCTRKELRSMAGAPHVGDMGATYPGTCRTLSFEQRKALELAGRKPCLRLRGPEGTFQFRDAVYGWQGSTLEECGGDFALRRSDGVIAYQLAVVADDGLMGITQVVRGTDLLASTPRQLALFSLLGYPPPVYMHVPLLCDEQGERLAKRHNSLSLGALRAQGYAPRALIGLLGWWAGFLERPEEVSPEELLPHFSPGRLSALGSHVCLHFPKN